MEAWLLKNVHSKRGRKGAHTDGGCASRGCTSAQTTATASGLPRSFIPPSRVIWPAGMDSPLSPSPIYSSPYSAPLSLSLSLPALCCSLCMPLSKPVAATPTSRPTPPRCTSWGALRHWLPHWEVGETEAGHGANAIGISTVELPFTWMPRRIPWYLRAVVVHTTRNFQKKLVSVDAFCFAFNA